MREAMLWTLLGYGLVLLILVYFFGYFRKDQHSLKEYLLANRSLGGVALAMTLSASYISVGSFMGGAGVAYKLGLGWVWLAMIQVPAMWLALGLLGRRVAMVAERTGALTLNDLLYALYPSRWVVWLASLTLLSMSFAIMTLQFMGAARLLESALQIPYNQALLFFVVVCALYTAFGGFRTVVWTDVFQGALMFLGSILLCWMAWKAVGQMGGVTEVLKQVDPALIESRTPERQMGPLLMVSFWVLVCWGVMGVPLVTVRCMAYRGSHALYRAMFVGTVVMAVVMLCIHLSAVFGRVLVPDLEVIDHVIPRLSAALFPPWLAALFLLAPLAAVMSTVDSMLAQSSATLIKDLFAGTRFARSASERDLTKFSKICTLLLCLALVWAAWKPPQLLILLNILALGGIQVVFLWPLVLGLFLQRPRVSAALSSMITGAVLYVGLHIFHFKPAGLHPVLPSLLAGFLVFACVQYFPYRRTSLAS